LLLRLPPTKASLTLRLLLLLLPTESTLTLRLRLLPAKEVLALRLSLPPAKITLHLRLLLPGRLCRQGRRHVRQRRALRNDVHWDSNRSIR